MIFIAPKILTMRPASLLDGGAAVFDRSAIQAVGPVEKILKKYQGHQILRLDNVVLMPGLVNLHTHLELPPLLNSVRATTFPDWVINLIREKRNLTDNDYISATQKNIQALLESGTTTVGEICTHRVSPALLKQSRLRSVIFHEIINMKAGAGQPGANVPLRSGRDSGLVQDGLSPHTPYTVSESALLQIKKFAQKRHLRLAMHVSESKDEIRLLQRKKSGLEKLYELAGWDPDRAPLAASSFEFLHRIGFLGPNVLAVHAVQVTDRDIRLIRKTGVSVAHCPRSNKETGVGKMPLKKFLDAGITVGLGTDSLASVPSLNMWDEMRYAYQIHRKDGITARDIFNLATIGGAKALGMDKEIGSLEPGKKADLIAVPVPKKNTGDIYSDLLRETKSCIMSMVNGKIIWTDNRDS